MDSSERRGTRRHRWIVSAGALSLAGAIVLSACSGSGSNQSAEQASDSAPPTDAPAATSTETETAPPATTVSFAESVQPIITNTCARCHTGDGPGATHLLLDTAHAVAKNAFDIATNVNLGAMPPWPASDHSLPFADNWSLSQAEVDAIRSWQEAGAPLDVDPNMAIVATHGVERLADVDVEVFGAGAYDGELGQPDEYRCLLFDPELDEDAYIQGYEFVPDQVAVVHHAIGYLIPAEARDRVAALEAEDGQAGWTCFGSSRLGVDEIFLGWAPGQGPTDFGAGSGIAMGAGDFMVVQIHYHFDVEAPADHSSLRVNWADGDDVTELELAEYVAPAEIPCTTDEEGPLCDRSAALARAVDSYGSEGVQANGILAACGFSADDFSHMTDGIAFASCDQPVREFGRLVSVFGHEHELGKSFRMTLNPDTPDERILLDIPEWSFDWQLNYYAAEDLTLSPGDWVRIECSWDRSLRDPDLEPAYVLWADGTNDEMCFSTILTESLPGSAGDAPPPTDFDATALFDDDVQACVVQELAGSEPLAADVVASLFNCEEADVIAARTVEAMTNALNGIPLSESQQACLQTAYTDEAAVAGLALALSDPANEAAVRSAAGTFADCAAMGDLVTELVPQLELSDDSRLCLNREGRDALIDIFANSVSGAGLDLPRVFLECLTPDELSGLGG